MNQTNLTTHVLGFFDDKGKTLRGGDFIRSVLQNATAQELDALATYARRQPGARGFNLELNLGDVVNSIRHDRARAGA